MSSQLIFVTTGSVQVSSISTGVSSPAATSEPGFTTKRNSQTGSWTINEAVDLWLLLDTIILNVILILSMDR